MDLYTFSLALGGAGLGVMAVAGLGHLGGHHGAGHAHQGGAGAHAGHGVHVGHHHHASLGGSQGAKPLASGVAALVSPRIIFSFLVGFGAAGLLLRSLIGRGPLLLAATVVLGIVFERFVVAPLWRFVGRFESKPALTLESCITDEARAVSSFDARGHGLVAVELDGQLVQVLGTLRHEDRDAGVRVRAGDRLRVEEVDGARNRCTVSYLGA
jgi:hypothetical protein